MSVPFNLYMLATCYFIECYFVLHWLQVERLKHKLDKKLGRNLFCKKKTGPLWKEHKFTPPRTRYSKGKKARAKFRQVFGDSEVPRKDGNPVDAHAATPSIAEVHKRQQVQELEKLKEMGVVRSGSGNRNLRKHIHNVARMSNRRLMIKPHRVSRKKSSVLVTTMEDNEDREEQHRELFHQQVGRFLQVPSHKQRVLEKLSANQVRNISNSEAVKRSKKVLRQASTPQRLRSSVKVSGCIVK